MFQKTLGSQLKSISVLWMALFFSSLAKAKTIIFVPGFFNSLAPGHFTQEGPVPYWSNDIVNVFREEGYEVFVADNLNPTGTIEENGERLLAYLDSIRHKIENDTHLNVIAHSAGGLYTLYAQNKKSLPIKKMITLNTPFDGIDFIDNITQQWPYVTDVEKLLNLVSLNQLRPRLVHNFLKTLSNPAPFPIDAYVGFQSANAKVWDAAYLSPIFFLTEALMSQNSDGIVTHNSARSNDGFVQVNRPERYIHLDHWKQVLDAHVFTALGMVNIQHIRREQVRFYSDLLSTLE